MPGRFATDRVFKFLEILNYRRISLLSTAGHLNRWPAHGSAEFKNQNVGLVDRKSRPAALLCANVDGAQLARSNPTQDFVGVDSPASS
jgi:hypothetical protein